MAPDQYVVCICMCVCVGGAWGKIGVEVGVGDRRTKKKILKSHVILNNVRKNQSPRIYSHRI